MMQSKTQRFYILEKGNIQLTFRSQCLQIKIFHNEFSKLQLVHHYVAQQLQKILFPHFLDSIVQSFYQKLPEACQHKFFSERMISNSISKVYQYSKNRIKQAFVQLSCTTVIEFLNHSHQSNHNTAVINENLVY